MIKIVNWTEAHFGKILTAMFIASFAILFSVIAHSNAEDVARSERASKYLSDHKCATIGYAGKNAEPVYQCDNGLVMRKQIP